MSTQDTPNGTTKTLWPWIVGVVVFVLVVPMIVFARNRTLFPAGPAKVQAASGPAVAGGKPLVAEELLFLPFGEGPTSSPILPVSGTMTNSSHETALLSRDGRYIWVIDHPKTGKDRTRVRRFTRDGKLEATFGAPIGSTLFTPGLTDDLWADLAGQDVKGEMLLHFDRDGKIIGRHPLPNQLYAAAISIDASGGVWGQHDEWTFDPTTNEGAWAGALVPIIDGQGKTVPNPEQAAVVQGAFIGHDGLLYSMEATQAMGAEGTERYTVIVRNPAGLVADFKVPQGFRPFAADSKGRVWVAAAIPKDNGTTGRQLIGDAATDSMQVMVLDHSGNVLSATRVQKPGPIGRAHPVVSLDTSGTALTSAIVDGGVRVLASVPSAAPGRELGSDSAEPDARIMYVGQAPLSGDPYAARDSFERDLWQMVYSGLVSHDASLAPVPDLAQAVPAPGAGISADGKRVTWTLRSDRRWHDGKPVTAEDVVATWNHLRAPSIAPGREPFPGFRYITDVEARGQEVVVTLSEPFGAAPEAFFPYVLPRHVVEPTLGAFNGGLYAAPTGSGPYEVVGWEQAGRMSLRASKFASSAPKIARLEVQFVTKDAARNAYLSSVVPSVWVWVPDVERQNLERDAFGRSVLVPSGRWFGQVFNEGFGAATDPKARAIIADLYPYDLDRRLASAVASSSARTGPYLVAPLEPSQPSRTPSEAVSAMRDYFEGQGYKVTPQGVLEKNRRRAVVAMSMGNDLRTMPEVPPEVFDTWLNWVQQSKAEGQLGLGQGAYHSPVQYVGYLSQGQQTIAAGVLPGFIDPAWGSLFDPADVPSWDNLYGRAISFTSDAELAQLHRQARATYDPAQRADLARSVAKRAEQLNLLRVIRPELRAANVNGVAGFSPAPYPAGDFYNVEDWTLEEAK